MAPGRTRTIVKVFGERNTGTRAVIQMLHAIPGISQRFGPQAAAQRPPDPELRRRGGGGRVGRRGG